MVPNTPRIRKQGIAKYLFDDRRKLFYSSVLYKHKKIKKPLENKKGKQSNRRKNYKEEPNPKTRSQKPKEYVHILKLKTENHCVPERQILCRKYGLENDQAAYEIIKKNESPAAINATIFLISIKVNE